MVSFTAYTIQKAIKKKKAKQYPLEQWVNKDLGEHVMCPPVVSDILLSRKSFSERAFPADDKLCHQWYTFIQAFSPKLVRYLLSKFNHTAGIILDPFVGAGTTCVECKILGIPSVGIDANPMAVFASRVKTTWDLDVEEVQQEKDKLAADVRSHLQEGNTGLEHKESEETEKAYPLLFELSIPPTVLTPHLVLKASIEEISNPKIRAFFSLALAATFMRSTRMIESQEKSRFALTRTKSIIQSYNKQVQRMIFDLSRLQQLHAGEVRIVQGDARQILQFLDLETVAGVITSPPYPVDTDYTRQTQRELAILDLAKNSTDLLNIEKMMIRGSRHHLYDGDSEIAHVHDFPEIQALLGEFRKVNSTDAPRKSRELYPRLIGEYFGGMYTHLTQLYEALKPDGWAAYVVGDKILCESIHIRSAEILAALARRLGYKIKKIEFWRKRSSTAQTLSIPEDILILAK